MKSDIMDSPENCVNARCKICRANTSRKKNIKLFTTEKAGFIISANIRSNASCGKNLTCSKAGGIARLAGLDVDANGGGGCI
jgi:hypothetical protein